MKLSVKKDFVHLHNHTQYSLMNGISRVRDLVEYAVKLNMKHIAITDHGNMSGLPIFIDNCKAHGINPIAGCELQIKKDLNEPKNLVLLAKNYEGYKNLIKLSSYGYIKTEHHKPIVNIEYLRNHSNGIICLSGGMKGEVSGLLFPEDTEKSEKVAIEYQEIFGKDNFYLEVEDHGTPEEKVINKHIVQLSKKMDIPIVAANNTYYLNKEDAEAQYVQWCLANGQKYDKKYLEQPGYSEYYIKSHEEMVSVFSDMPEALENTLLIAKKCNLIIDLPGSELPDFKISLQFLNANEYLHHLALEGLKDRYETITKEILERFDYELEIIIASGFANYFLIVHDYANWAHLHDIPVGSGYGKTPGSIVAYSLKLTDIDPLKYGLLFECFINPKRIVKPNIILDFCSTRREELIKYITETYGHAHVGGISQFKFRDTKSVILNIANILDIPDSDKILIKELFPSNFYLPMQSVMDKEPELTDLKQKNDKLQKLFEISSQLDRLYNYRTTHERAIVMGRRNLADLIPLYNNTETELFSVQYEGYYELEENGFVLFELFGMESLTFIRKVEDLIRKKNPGFLIKDIPIDDEATLDIFRKGDTKDIFEFQSLEMQEFLRQMSPDSFEDLIVLNALHFSFSWQYIPELIDRKNGSIKITYPDPSLEEILKPTYGIFVYPEQFMEAASKVSGFPLGKSWSLWEKYKYISEERKKIEEDIKRDKIEFINGAVGRGYSKNRASNIFDVLIFFDGNISSKSHAAAYTMIAYHMAFLKAHYPEEFRIGLIDY